MFWQISKLVLIIWRNRLHQLLRRYPMLWSLVLLLPLTYGSGTYLAYSLVYKMLQPFEVQSMLAARLQSAVIFAFFCTFGLSAFLLMISSTLFSPDETIIKRVFVPLPISPLHRRVGVLVPGILFLIGAQIVLWVPILVAMVQVRFASLPALLGATIMGLLCYNTATLAFYQCIYYFIARLFGAGLAGLRSTTVGLSISVGLIILMVPLIVGVQALLTGITPWLWFVPSFWMSLILSHNGADILLGLSLLSVLSILCIGLYLLFIQLSEHLVSGTKGFWTPLKHLSFGKHILIASCVYEWKMASRDQQLIIGLSLVTGGAIASTIAFRWIDRQNTFLSHVLIQFSISIITVLMCAVAHMSWGRDRVSRRILVPSPLKMQWLVTGKLLANCLAIIGYWCVLTTTMACFANEVPFLISQVPILLLGIVLAFWLGIAIPYATDDPFSMLLVMGIMTVFGLPLYAIIQKGQDILNSIPISTTAAIFLKLLTCLITAIVCYKGIIWLDNVRMEKDYD